MKSHLVHPNCEAKTKIKSIKDGKIVIVKADKVFSAEEDSFYMGPINNGKKEGKGCQAWPDGSTYEGELKGNKNMEKANLQLLMV